MLKDWHAGVNLGIDRCRQASHLDSDKFPWDKRHFVHGGWSIGHGNRESANGIDFWECRMNFRYIAPLESRWLGKAEKAWRATADLSVPGQSALPTLSGLKRLRKKRIVWVLIIEKLWLKRICVSDVCQHVEFLCIGIWYTFGGIPDLVLRRIFWSCIGIPYTTWRIRLRQWIFHLSSR